MSIGKRREMLRTLALSTVQRQAAASMSASPSNSRQHLSWSSGRLILTRPPRTLAHTSSLSVSTGHRPAG
ncbi:hypothetical protein PAHAL_9G391700 [Panicum hallii]|uniref:Uncharacterized protein n=1 Tax=Panicum hallii TaxID=206008 RepID=A0A2T8I3Z7_9POAL|nr:hypothetical protein PAHAL_9G391700 [Panicum hallii]